MGEYLVVSILVDLPQPSADRHWLALLRMVVPIAIGTAAAGWLVARARTGGPAAQEAEAPPWRPWPGLLANLAIFALAVGLAWLEFGPDAPAPTPAGLLALLSLAALAAFFAATTAGPVPWLARRLRPLLGLLPVALGVGLAAFWVTASVGDAWGLLSVATVRAVAAVLRAAGERVVVAPAESVVGLRGFEVQIAPVCSGIDGIGLVLLFQAIWLSLARDRIRLPAGLLLLPLGAACAFAANVARIAVLVWVGAKGSPELALGVLHSKLGWILFVALALATVGLAEHLSWLRRPAGAAGPEGETGAPSGTAAYLGPLVAALATGLVTSAWAAGPLDLWYGARIAAAAAALLAVWGSLPSLRPSRSWLPALLGAGVAVAWVASSGGDGARLSGALAGLSSSERWTWIAVRAAGSIAVIPLAEELAFRGFLLPWLVSPELDAVPPRAWTWFAVLVSSLAFGAIHAHFLLGTLAGLAFAFVRLWRGRLGDAVVAHAVANAGVAVAVVLGGRWNLWG